MNAVMSWLVTGSGLEHIGIDAPCWELPAFPPPDDFPIMVRANGEVVSRWRDPIWVVGEQRLNFGYIPTPRQTLELTSDNGELLKRCTAWLMWGERRPIGTRSLKAYHGYLKRILATCSKLTRPVVGSDMGRFFDTIELRLAEDIGPASARVTLPLLHELWSARHTLGFELLSPMQIDRLATLIPKHEVEQHQFIPPRIWAYQAARMKMFLEDFLAHKEQIYAAFEEVAEAYRVNFGSLANARTSKTAARNPCHQSATVDGCVYLGSFFQVAQRHGIEKLIARWLFAPPVTWDTPTVQRKGVRILAMYLNAVDLVGTAYLQCFSGMRLMESMSLRTECLTVETDDVLGAIHILSAETTKTTEDPDARWLTAPTASLAIDSLAPIARWRTDIAIELGDIPLSDQARSNPYLVQRCYEPWSSGVAKGLGSERRPGGKDIAEWRTKVPGLFDVATLRITTADEAYVRRFSSNANLSEYGEGCVWHFTSHQYRRTAAVMMGASQVSLEAQQYQFKHLTRNQSAYYRQGSANLRLNRSFGHELMSTRYELVSVELALLSGPEYVSPISPARKDQILNFHEIGTGAEIQKAIRKGQLVVKQTLFGVCTRRDRCPYGGHDNFVHCPDCNDAFLSRRKRSAVETLGKTIALRLVDAPEGTPLHDQLRRSQQAIGRFMDVTDA